MKRLQAISLANYFLIKFFGIILIAYVLFMLTILQ